MMMMMMMSTTVSPAIPNVKGAWPNPVWLKKQAS